MSIAEDTALALESVNDVDDIDSQTAGMLGGGQGITDGHLEEHLEFSVMGLLSVAADNAAQDTEVGRCRRRGGQGGAG